MGVRVPHRPRRRGVLSTLGVSWRVRYGGPIWVKLPGSVKEMALVDASRQKVLIPKSSALKTLVDSGAALVKLPEAIWRKAAQVVMDRWLWAASPSGGSRAAGSPLTRLNG